MNRSIHRGGLLLTLSLLFLPLAGAIHDTPVTPGRLAATAYHAPVAVDDVFDVVEGTALTSAAPGVLENDTNATSASLVSGPLHGTLQLNVDGSFTYTHDGLGTAQDSFTYQASDGVSTDVATVTLNITSVSFGVSALASNASNKPTSLQFGPDSLLYVLEKVGKVRIMEVTRNAANSYQVASEEVVTLVRNVPNYDDDGTANPGENSRQATGIVVTGTASNPVLYVSSSDSRVGGNGGAQDTGLDTNSGVISRLTWNGASRHDPSGFWERVDIVRGLARSEENHAVNGMALSLTGDTLFVAVGGFTNAGAPSNNFAFITEYAYAAAIVGINLPAVNGLPTLTDSRGAKYKYNMPTLDDPTRPNVNGITDPNLPGYDGIDVGDPWGGNDGLNQAKIVPGEPVFLHAAGFRNPYDVVVTRTPGRAGRMYSIDNGANGGWGGHPWGEGMAGTCTNQYDPLEPGSNTPGPNDPQVNNYDNLHYVHSTVPGQRFYGGHPAPIRGNPAGAGLYTGDYNADSNLNTGVWRDGTDTNYPLPADWPPVPLSMALPDECDYRSPGETDGALSTFKVSTNGLAEYTASNFNNKFKGDLFAAGYNNNTIYRIDLNEAGDQVLNNHPAGNGTEAFFTNFGSVPLDVTAQGDNDPFPGTIWVADFTSYDIWVFEPGDYDGNGGGVCTGVSDPFLDEDNDGFDNEDELMNGSNPCSAASKPADNDGDLTSDLIDPDDDNDGVDDIHDAFAIDDTNGANLTLPVIYPLLNEDPGTGFFGVGFTGLMTNGTTDYLDLYDENELIPGGTAGLFTVSTVSEGDATGATNTQEYGFQFGVNVAGASGPYTVKVKMPGPFFGGMTPQDNQAQGMYIGTGDMDNYVRLVLNAQAGVGGVQVTHEEGGVATVTNYTATTAIGATNLDLWLTVDPVAGTVQPKYVIDSGYPIFLGLPIPVSGNLLAAIQGSYEVSPGVPSGLAVGIISTSAGAGPAFAATWDAIDVVLDPTPIADRWHTYQAPTNPKQRHESSFVKHDGQFYLMGGRGSRKTDRFNPATGTWTSLTLPPIEFNHFQAVSLGDSVYVAGAYVGDFPSEVPVPNIYTYAPGSDTWSVGATIPAARQRGSAGVVTYNGKLYLVSGSLGGHSGSAVHLPLFDEYDPATGTWTVMPDMPHPRDHFNAAVVGDKIYVAGGRAGSVGDTVEEVDVFDFVSGTWSTLPALSGNIPTPRGGTAAAVVGSDLFIMGGESGLQTLAHSEVEVLDTNTNSWRTLDALDKGRHGTAAVVDGTRIYIAAGSGETGGGPELASMEVFNRTALSDPGSVVPSTLSAAPASLAFGQVNLGANDAQMIALFNTGGNQNVTISNIALSGGADFSLSYGFTLPAVLMPDDTVYVDVTFAPTLVGAANATLDVTHDGANGTVSVAISGDGAEGGGTVSTGNPIYRVNAGGSNTTDALLDWDRDTKNVPSPYVNAGGDDNKTGKINSFTGTNETNAPDDVYTKNRWDPAGGVEMTWNFPVSEIGLYQVNLYFIETDASNYAVGGRVFDISMEGALVFEDFDIFAEAGANTALVKSSVVNVTDGNVTIELGHVIDNPVIQALEIRPVLGADLFASPATVDFFSVPVNEASVPMKVYFSNTSLGSVTVTGVTISGSEASDFSHDFAGSVSLASGETDSLSVVLTPGAEGLRNASLEIAHTGAGSPAVVALTGEGTNVHLSFVEFTIVGSGSVSKSPDKPLYADGEVVTLTATADPGWLFDGWSGDLVSPDNPVDFSVYTDATITATFIESATTIDPIYRVNAGSGSVSDTPIVWERDTKNKPVAYNNANVGDNAISKSPYTGPNATDAPSDVYGSNRWDPAGNLEMEWDFPVGLAGDYEVNLYFAETNSGSQNPGDRIFDVVIEGNLVLDDYDVVSDAGFQTAVKKSFIVNVVDGNIDINFLHVVDNPFVSAIEIVPTPATVPAEARYNGVDNTFIVRKYQQVLDGSWSLVGLPLDTEGDAAAAFEADELLQYADGKYAATAKVESGRGYWMRSEDETLTTLQGTRFDTMTVALKAGWNLIAGTSCDVELSLMAGADRIIPHTLYRYDTDSGYQPTDHLQQGRGYWVRAREAGAVQFDCGVTTSFRLPVEPNDLSSFGRVLIVDQEGHGQQLYFGGQIDDALLPQYSMPPLAPGTTFDIRFADQSRLAKPTANVVQLQNAVFPLTLQMEALPEGGHDNEYVVSLMRNEVEVEAYRVRSGGTLSIEESDIDALKILSLSEWQAELPESFGLKGNYPNPFNPVTQIVFDLPEAADVSIEVFDLLGRRVRQIGTLKLAAGQSRQIEMDGRGLASGVYLYRVEAVMASKTVSDTGKMILVK